jgi:histidinol dehydrogenase
LNVRSFLKMMHIVSYTQTAFAEVARKVEVFADAEDLPAHGAAIARRFFPTTRAQ